MFTSMAPGGLTGKFVKSIWLHEGERPVRRTELRLPTGAVELMFNLRADCFWLPDNAALRQVHPGAVMAGPYQRAYVLDTAQQSHVLGVVFRPGGARPLIDAPLHELCDRHVALEDLWGASAGLVREQVLAAPDAATRLRTLESALRDRLARSAEIAHPLAAAATACLADAPGRHDIGRLGEHLGWSLRRVEQVFRTDVGLSPKSYQRLQRFRSALAGIDGSAQLGWSAFALEHGYYDQAHLSREFRAHCGLSPTAYLQQRGEQLNHVPLPT
ncbi:helix-turn-helix domain-containing protein [Haloactinomyces albus]|uniref:AraC-like DNA-binding protein n=1 Tax=Haloactinomyces albus TaxID=1352928 RepID=A0AAE3ZEZ7_9ACTN|nr:helix-turn-helix domain-containing protein [Haloactinomyces albus]MDR7303723.1 AraC-like DNA-binding protein [Haloactinomyces albus]